MTSRRRRAPLPGYAEARTALAQHLHRHHDGAYGQGTLAERVSQHDDLHFLRTSQGKAVSHQHAMLGDNETMIDVAHRYLREGSNG